MGPNAESLIGSWALRLGERGLKDSLERSDMSRFDLYKPSSASSKEEAWDWMGLGTGDQLGDSCNGQDEC